MDKWKILCWLSEVQVLLLPPVVSDFFPDNACDAEQCEWWCHPVGIECDRGDGRTKHTISHGQASPLWWLNIICEILHIMSALRNIDPLTICPLMNIPIRWNITRISSYRRNHASRQKSFPFQINIKRRYNVDHSSATKYQQALSKRATGQKVSSTMQEELITRKRCQPPTVARSQWSKCHTFFLSTHHRGETMSAVTMSTYKVLFLTVPP